MIHDVVLWVPYPAVVGEVPGGTGRDGQHPLLVERVGGVVRVVVAVAGAVAVGAVAAAAVDVDGLVGLVLDLHEVHAVFLVVVDGVVYAFLHDGHLDVGRRHHRILIHPEDGREVFRQPLVGVHVHAFVAQVVLADNLLVVFVGLHGGLPARGRLCRCCQRAEHAEEGNLFHHRVVWLKVKHILCKVTKNSGTPWGKSPTQRRKIPNLPSALHFLTENSIFINSFLQIIDALFLATRRFCRIFAIVKSSPPAPPFPSHASPASVRQIPRFRPPIPPLPSNEKFSNTKTQRHKESRKKIKTKIHTKSCKNIFDRFLKIFVFISVTLC